MKRMTMVTVLTIFFLLTSTFALGHQGRPLAKIRVDDSGNVEILEITGDANTSFSGQPLQQNQEKTKHINNPASPMSLPDLEFVTSASSYNFEFLEITFDIRIRNTGTDPTGTFSIGYYLSADQNLSPGERIYSETQSSIAGGATVDVHREIDEYGGELHFYPGTWYVGCILDIFGNVAESDENNNTLVLLNKLLIPEIPDLTVSGHLLNNNGPIIDYEMDILNHGTKTSDPCIVAVFLSTDQIIDPSDDLLLEQPCSSVGEGWYADYFPTADLTGKPGGEYYMLLKVDYYNVVDEYYEDNNEDVAENAFTRDPIITIYPDLVVSLIQLPDDEGPEITYVIDVMNLGDAATSGTFKNKIYLSADQNITDSDYLINDWNVTQSILPGNYKRSPDLTTTVSGVPYGDYWLGVIADADEDINELNEDNNTGYYSAYQVNIDLPDINIIECEVINGIGPQIYYHFLISNDGSVGTGIQFDYSVFLSLNDTWDASDYMIEQVDIGPFDPGDYVEHSPFIDVVGVPDGEYFLLAIGDFKEQIDESDEDNNLDYDPINKVIISSSGVESSPIPARFDLKSAYPNPFNVSATIQFDIPESCPVSLKIYSSTGQHIATLVDEIRSAGVYPVVWNAEDLPSGMYMVQLKAGDYTETIKLILQK